MKEYSYSEDHFQVFDDIDPETRIADAPNILHFERGPDGKLKRKATHAPVTTFKRTPDPQPQPSAKTSSVLARLGGRFASTITQREVEWLWRPFIPLGHLTIIFGFGGIGKGHITAFLASAISTGAAFPHQSSGRSPQTAVMISTEDDAEETITPRLAAAGADLNRVLVIDKPFKLDKQGLADLEALIIELGATMVTIDPWVSVAGGKLDMHKANEVRAVLEPLEALARKHHCAIVLVAHSKKPVKGGLADMHALFGSVDMTNAARSTIHMFEEGGKTFFQQQKNNYEKNKSKLEYTIEKIDSSSRLVFGKVVDDPDGETRPSGPKEAQAIVFLKTILRDGPVLATTIEAKGQELGLSLKTINRAKIKAGAESVFKLDTREWRWRLKEPRDGQ